MTGWPKGLTKEAAKALSPEERKKLWNKDKDVVPDSDAAIEHNAQPASRPRLEARVPSKPQKKTWQMRAGNNWSAEGDLPPEAASFPTDIPEEWPEGMALQWITTQVRGQPTPERMIAAQRSGWTPVHNDDFDNWHSRVLGGRFSLDEGGYIVKDNSLLCALPMPNYQKLKKRDEKAAQDQVTLKQQAFTGGEMNATGANHPSAVATNRITRSMERIEIPKE